MKKQLNIYGENINHIPFSKSTEGFLDVQKAYHYLITRNLSLNHPKDSMRSNTGFVES